MREMLNGEWVWFQQVLIDSNIMLQKHKEKFKNSLVLSSEEFKKRIQSFLQEFNSTGHTFSLLLSLSQAHIQYIITKHFITVMCAPYWSSLLVFPY